MIEISTERLVLRDFRTTDEQAVHEFASDPAVCRHTDWGPNSPDDTRLFIREAVDEAASPNRDSFTLAMSMNPSGVVVGSCSVWVESASHRRAGLGFVVAPAHQGRGYASEAGKALLDFAFEVMGVQRVEATCRPGNLASARVLTKLGMRREGLLRSHLLIRGRQEDSVLFASTRS
ncbi:GNAT family N-acetyltransferase [Actinopolymorpha pittospori]